MAATTLGSTWPTVSGNSNLTYCSDPSLWSFGSSNLTFVSQLTQVPETPIQFSWLLESVSETDLQNFTANTHINIDSNWVVWGGSGLMQSYDWCTFTNGTNCPQEYIPGNLVVLQSPIFQLSLFGGPKKFSYTIDVQFNDGTGNATLFCATGTMDQNNMPGLKESVTVAQDPFQEEL
ncbi:hypothetical protein EJ05DRAFT_472725, partial [Pseudovirgaria hyperparasitica]